MSGVTSEGTPDEPGVSANSGGSGHSPRLGPPAETHADIAAAAWRSASSSRSAETPLRGAMISSINP